MGPSTKELIDGGYLSPVRCFVPPQRIDRARLRTVAGDYVRDQLASVMDHAVITGDAIVHYRRQADHQPAIAFCSRVDHAEHVAQAFRAAGYRSHCVHGGTRKDERDALIAGLGNGAVEVLTSADLISEGLDVPVVGAVILLRPTKSLVLHRQQIGRGMRPAPGKVALIVNDHVGNCLTHGLPEIEPVWSLDGVEKPAGEAPVWECPECGCLNPLNSRVCEACGYERPAPERGTRETIPGELTELTAEQWAQIAGRPY
jgi:superfamily II DNA or RNA helicase